MSKQTWKIAVVGIGIVSILAMGSMPLLAGQGAGKADTAMKSHKGGGKGSHAKHAHQAQADKMKGALDAIDAAIEAVQADNKHHALASLKKAKQLLSESRTAMLKAGKAVNFLCPMMGSKIKRGKVPAKLARLYKDKKIGFCCGGCPVAWDKLSDEDKAKKLQAATSNHGSKKGGMEHMMGHDGDAKPKAEKGGMEHMGHDAH